jgi:phosphatidylinositol alpha-1,6-mannosyltransferase
MLLGLFTGLFHPGGVEQVNRHTAAALTLIAHDQALRCKHLSLNDNSGLHSFIVDGYECTVQGFARRNLEFILHTLRMAHQTRMAYIGHPNLAPLGLLLHIINPRLKYWVRTHGVEVWYPLPFLRRLALRMAHGITASSQFTAEQMIKAQKLQSHRIIVLPPALEPGFTNGAGREPMLLVPSQSKIILTVGRLIFSEPGKGVDMVIRALPKVLGTIPDTYYVVVGDGDYRSSLERLADEMGVRDRVLFVGVIGEDILKAYYSKAHIFALPSRQEGFGVVFLEAMAFGKPVIGGNHGGIPEVVKDGVTGFLVEYGNVEALANHLILLMHNEEERKRMGEAGRQLVNETYTFEHFRQRLVKVLP